MNKKEIDYRLKKESDLIEDAIHLLNGEIVISNYVKSAKQIKETYDYLIELPVDMTAKEWLNIQKVSDGLIYGKQESMRDPKGGEQTWKPKKR